MTTFLRITVFSLFFLMLSLSPAMGQASREAVLTLKDGRTVKGVVAEENDQSVTVVISGIKTPYSRDLIKTIEYIKTVEEEYAERRSKVTDADVSGRYQIARWLFEKRSYVLAKKELDDLAKRDPKNADIGLLKRIVEERIKAEGITPGTTPGTTPDTPGTTPGTETGGDVTLPKDRLDAKMINRLRVLEVNENLNPRVTVPPNVVEKFLNEFADNDLVPKGATARNRFKAQKDIEKLKLMLEVGAGKFFEDVISHDDPPAIRDFRNIHRNYVLSFCATNECHGGAKAGKFFLFNSAPTSNETIHTNFYILTQTKTKTAYMVDRDYPTKSLIVQFGMPIDKAQTPHPDVPGFRAPMLTGDKDRTYQMLVEWISKSLYRPEPKYNLQYRIPTLSSPAAPKAPEADPPAAKTP